MKTQVAFPNGKADFKAQGGASQTPGPPLTLFRALQSLNPRALERSEGRMRESPVLTRKPPPDQAKAIPSNRSQASVNSRLEHVVYKNSLGARLTIVGKHL